jgi:hypothetical protein
VWIWSPIAPMAIPPRGVGMSGSVDQAFVAGS